MRLSVIERMIYPLALLTSVIGVVYWYWTTTPNYALTQIVMSVYNHDRPSFEKYVDIDSLAAHGFDDVVTGPAGKNILGPTASIDIGFFPMLKPVVVEIVRHKLQQVVSHGKIDANMVGTGLSALVPGAAIVWTNQTTPNGPTLVQAREAAGQSEPAIIELDALDPETRKLFQAYGLTRGGFRGVKYLTTDSGTARLGLQFYSPKFNQNWVAEFKLEDVGGFWRVTQLSNLRELMTQYVRTMPPVDMVPLSQSAIHPRRSQLIKQSQLPAL